MLDEPAGIGQHGVASLTLVPATLESINKFRGEVDAASCHFGLLKYGVTSCSLLARAH